MQKSSYFYASATTVCVGGNMFSVRPSVRVSVLLVWNGLKDFHQILHKYSVPALDELITVLKIQGSGSRLLQGQIFE